MAFWKKKSEDPWDMDPNQKRKPVLYYERESELQAGPMPQAVSRTRDQEGEGLAMPESAAEPEVQEEPEDAPDCPWCGGKMVRAYLLGGQDMIRFADQKPHSFWGSLGHEKTYLHDDASFLSGNYKSCWQCKPCFKLVIDIPKPDALDSMSGTIWDENPAVPQEADTSEN